MADLVLTDLGADAILNRAFKNTFPVGGANLTLRLFCNNYTPVQGSTTANFTEAAGGGYAAITLAAASWTLNTANDPSDVTYAEQTFSFTGALTTNPTIYGYFLTDADNVTIYAQLWSSPYTPASAGDTYKVTPKVQASSGTPA